MSVSKAIKVRTVRNLKDIGIEEHLFSNAAEALGTLHSMWLVSCILISCILVKLLNTGICQKTSVRQKFKD